MEMSVKLDDNQTKEVDIQSFLKELETFNKQTKQMEEQVIKMRVECALKAVEVSTRVETNDSINGLNECHRNVNQIESNFQTKPNPEIKPIKAEDNQTNG